MKGYPTIEERLKSYKQVEDDLKQEVSNIANAVKDTKERLEMLNNMLNINSCEYNQLKLIKDIKDGRLLLIRADSLEQVTPTFF